MKRSACVFAIANTQADRTTIVSLRSSDGKNVHLDSGTRMLLVTQPAPEVPAQSQ